MSDVEPGSFHPFEVSATHIIYVGLGVFVALFGMFSLFIKEKLYLGEAPIAAIFGIIVGPVALNLFDPSNWGGHKTDTPGGHITNEITLEVMRVTIALSVFAVGVELPKKYLLRHWRSIALLLGPVMVWGWLVTAAFMYALVPGLDFLNCLVVASCVTPTDPILAQAVVGGPWAEKHVPAHLRHMLMCESGCNDGAAFPFLYLALFLTTNRDNHGKAIAEWFYDAWAYQIIFGTLLGALIGWAARKLMRFSERHKLVDRESFVAQYVSLAVASMGVNVLLGSDDLLAAFACGTAFAWDGWFTKQTEDSNFSSIVDLLFNVATFIYIGALMPFHDFVGGSDAERNTLSLWRLFVLAICVLLTKRLPIVVALWRWIPDIKTFREAVFAGHFGPIGVGAIFIATLARTLLPEEVASPPETSNDYLALTVQPIIFFFVLCSIIIHGLTIPFFAFSRRATTMTRTWSRHPSLAPSEEPGWLSRIRRTRTGEKAGDGGLEAEEGNMTEIERVLNAQLGIIGRGAIGGDAEKELRREGTSDDSETARADADADDSSGSGGGLAGRARLTNARTTKGLNAVDGFDDDEDAAHNSDCEEDHRDMLEDPTGEWGGEDTVEMRRYRAKQAERRERQYVELRAAQQGEDERRTRAHDRRQGDAEDADLGLGLGHRRRDRHLDHGHGDDGDDGEERGPMDRDLNRGDVTKDAGVRREEREEAKADAAAKEDEEEERRDREGRARYGCATEEESSEERDERRQDAEHAAILRDQQRERAYPVTRSWVEGSKLVIEYQEHKSSEAECHVIPLTDDDRESVSSAESPAHAWAQHHSKAIEHHLGLSDVYEWHPTEAAKHLVHHSIPSLYAEHLDRKRKALNAKRRGSLGGRDETAVERNARADMLYGAMEWASQHREPASAGGRADAASSSGGASRPTSMLHDGSSVSRRSTSSATHFALPDSAAEGRRRKMPPKKKPPAHVQPSDTESDDAEITGWLSPSKPGVTRKVKKPAKRVSSSSPSRSPSASPTRRDSSPSTGPAAAAKSKVYVCKPSATDARRMSMRKKILAGQLSLKGRPGSSMMEPHADQDDEVMATSPLEYDAEGPASSSSAASSSVAGGGATGSASRSHFFPRSASAGGLGESSPSSPSFFFGRQQQQQQQQQQPMQRDRSGASLAIPRTRTLGVGEDGGGSGGGAGRDGRRDHSRASSVQWLDIPEGSHEHQQRPSRPVHHLAIPSFFGGGTSTPRGGASRPTSRSGSPSRSPTTTFANLPGDEASNSASASGSAPGPGAGLAAPASVSKSRSNASLRPPPQSSDNGLQFQRYDSVGGLSNSGGGEEPASASNSKRRGRIAALIQNLTTPSSSRSQGQQQSQQQSYEARGDETPTRQQQQDTSFGSSGGILTSNPPSRSGTATDEATGTAGATALRGQSGGKHDDEEVLDDSGPAFGNTVTFA